ncbi:hypothetical protein [Streptomyces sp. NPDC052036]|uniref:hypothetical protein n=1 Tax=Streptomyces sp. NPDC052036 TaxID=3155171 RepID=UPI00341BCC0F
MIDAADRIVVPGFVDTHLAGGGPRCPRGLDVRRPPGVDPQHAPARYRPEDAYLGNLLGRVEALHSGVTTMLD